MRKVYFNQMDFYKYEVLKVHQNYESTLYVNGRTLYKVYKSERFSKDDLDRRYRNVSLVSEANIANFVELYDAIFNPDTNQFIGVSEEYLIDYQTLRNYSHDVLYDYKTRLQLCYSILETYEDLLLKEFYFSDIHYENALVKGRKLLFVDIDGVSRIESCGIKTLDDYTLFMKKRCLDLILHLILNSNLWLESPRTSLNNNYGQINKKVHHKFDRTDPIIAQYFEGTYLDNITLDSQLEDILSTITEDKVMTLNKTIRKVTNII